MGRLEGRRPLIPPYALAATSAALVRTMIGCTCFSQSSVDVVQRDRHAAVPHRAARSLRHNVVQRHRCAPRYQRSGRVEPRIHPHVR